MTGDVCSRIGWVRSLVSTNASAAVLLIRLMVGLVFVSEGLQKFLFSARGIERFAHIGLPMPNLLAPFVGGFEIVCGLAVVMGVLTRVAAVPLIVIMLVALVTTKLPILFEKGFWDMAHEMRTDWAMLCGACFLLWMGAGRLSLDALLQKCCFQKQTPR